MHILIVAPDERLGWSHALTLFDIPTSGYTSNRRATGTFKHRPDLKGQKIYLTIATSEQNIRDVKFTDIIAVDGLSPRLEAYVGHLLSIKLGFHTPDTFSERPSIPDRSDLFDHLLQISHDQLEEENPDEILRRNRTPANA